MSYSSNSRALKSRRNFLKASTLVALPFFAKPVWGLSTFLVAAPSTLELDLRAFPRSVSLYPDHTTDVWSYQALFKAGPANRIKPSGNGFLGPIIEVRQGERLKIQYLNDIPDESIVHWHGLDVPADQDGHPHATVPPGDVYEYEFEVTNRAGLYFFHPHPHGKLGAQVTKGLMGIMIVRDQEEDLLGLPAGENEHIICIQDRRVDANRQFEYLTGGMHDRMMGMHGNQLFLNGELNLNRKVKRGMQRLRVMNGSNARVYNLTWSDGRPLTVIGTDGGLLSSPTEYKSLLLAPAERLDILVDCTSLNASDKLRLESAPLVAGSGKPFTVLELEATADVGFSYTIPTKLSEIKTIDEKESVNAAGTKSFVLIPTREHGWTIDGQTYDMHGASPKETVNFGDTEIWEFDNTQTGMLHPMHIHGSQFQVLRRLSGGKLTGAMDLGWKDTVLLLPGDKVQVIKRFNSHKGMFVYHCHNLEHEDSTMMRNFLIK